MGISMKDLEKLKKLGKIRGYQDRVLKPVTVDVGGRKVTKVWSTKDERKDWIAANFLYWCNSQALTMEEEYRFHVERKWRFDWAAPALKIAVEYEGLMSEKSRHTTVGGYSRDTEKYRAAALAGWIVLRYTAVNYRQLIDDLNQFSR